MGNRDIPGVRGMRDVLPEAAGLWRRFETAAAHCFHLYGYGEIRTPLVEHLDLFKRQLGEDTDIVRKEMYTFTDSLNDETLALRPEATVPTVRALLAAGAHRAGISRVWYSGAMFRHERPQKGRYRQFHQMGVEALGSTSPLMEAEQITLLHRLWREVGIADRLRLSINNLGNPAERAAHKKKLRDYFEPHSAQWDDTLRQRLHNNPWRLLDDKSPALQALIADAPTLSDELSDASRRHTDAVKMQISKNGIAFAEAPHLVRGLDYYNLTVYEWTLADDDRRQNAVCGGGRYDGLAEKISGHSVAGCGFALGSERVLDIMEDTPPPSPDCYMAVVDDTAECRAYAQQLAEKCRDENIATLMGKNGDKLGRQLSKAEKMNIRAVAVIGNKETQAQQVTLKPLNGADNITVAAAGITQSIKSLIAHV